MVREGSDIQVVARRIALHDEKGLDPKHFFDGRNPERAAVW